MRLPLTALLLATNLAVAADLSVTDARARAVPPTAEISAAFMTLTNNANEDVALVSAQSSVAESVELHTNSMTDGKMKMRRIDQIELPAQQSTKLEPGGLHIMLIGLKKPLKMGETVDLELSFSDGTNETMNIPVEHVMTGMKKGMH